MIIGFTGTQRGMTQFQREELFKILKLKECSEFVFGDCIGADEQSAIVAINAGVTVFSIHPPDNPVKRAWCFDPEKKMKWNRIITPFISPATAPDNIKVRWYPLDSYQNRNRHIVDQTQLLIATPKEFTHEIRSGTWSTVRYAWKLKKDVLIIPPVDRPEKITDEELSRLVEEAKGE